MPIAAETVRDIGRALRAGKAHRAIALVANEAVFEARRQTMLESDPVDAFLAAMSIIEGFAREARKPYERTNGHS